MRQCAAMTQKSTYSEAHRCLRPAGEAPGLLCTLHRSMAQKRAPRL
ncbi:MAG: hypothetical protein KGL53_01705 [Elusimicrobia bacterium]|nr:hypothetical protein [Elusimicrobiota bacterium]